MKKKAIRCYMNWSGGKDSSLCLYKVLADARYTVGTLLTSVNVAHDRVSMHGVRRELLEAQAKSIGLPLSTIELPEQPSMGEYEKISGDKAKSLKQQGYIGAVFGDIFLEDLRAYRERMLASAGIECIFPLWQKSTSELMTEFLQLGFKAIVVCVNSAYLDSSFCGRLIDEKFVKDLPKNVDVCGENGEYHSFVFEGPIFDKPILFTKGDVVERTYDTPKSESNKDGEVKDEAVSTFYFCDLIPS